MVVEVTNYILFPLAMEFAMLVLYLLLQVPFYAKERLVSQICLFMVWGEVKSNLIHQYEFHIRACPLLHTNTRVEHSANTPSSSWAVRALSPIVLMRTHS